MTPPSMSIEFIVGAFIFGGLSILVALLAVSRRRSLSRRAFAAACTSALLLAVGAGAMGALHYDQLVRAGTWHFYYGLDVRPNATSPEAIVVPIPSNESLLAGLRVTSGTANWSLVDTPDGRGLWVQFAGAASLAASFSEYPPTQRSSGETFPTMAEGDPWRSEEPDLWIFYVGTGGEVGLVYWVERMSLHVHDAMLAGWALYSSQAFVA